MSRVLALVLGLVLALGFGSSAVAADKWNMASGYPDGNYHTQNIKQFLDDVQKAAAGKLEITLHANQSLFKLTETKRAVQSGQVQVGELLLANFGNEDPIFDVSSVPFLADTYPKAKKLWEVTRPIIAERLARQGIRLLYGVPWPPQGFYTKTPVTSVADFKGLKMRTYSVQTARMAELMGAIPTTVQFSEVPQAFGTGLVASMYTSPQTGLDTQAWDFSRHFTSVGGNHTMNVVIVNEAAFKRLPADVQAAMLDAAQKAEARGWKMSEEVTSKQIQTLKDKGMTVVDASPEFRAQLEKIGATLTEEWAKKAGDVGQTVVRKFRE
ncbi:MAG: TRAP transporter substrate-binding protein [Candidatus Rokuibacteriota bacterium]